MEKQQFMLKFRGSKVELHRQLKEWCEDNDEKMNPTIISLIDKFLKQKYGKQKVSAVR